MITKQTIELFKKHKTQPLRLVYNEQLSALQDFKGLSIAFYSKKTSAHFKRIVFKDVPHDVEGFTGEITLLKNYQTGTLELDKHPSNEGTDFVKNNYRLFLLTPFGLHCNFNIEKCNADFIKLILALADQKVGTRDDLDSIAKKLLVDGRTRMLKNLSRERDRALFDAQEYSKRIDMAEKTPLLLSDEKTKLAENYIDDINITKDYIVVLTKPIKMDGRDMNRYILKFGYNDNGSLSLRIQSPTMANYIHPHVDVDGSLCSGNTKIETYLQQGLLTDSIILVCEMLQKYTKSSEYSPLELVVRDLDKAHKELKDNLITI